MTRLAIVYGPHPPAPLSHRGYALPTSPGGRESREMAPIRQHLATVSIIWAGWQGPSRGRALAVAAAPGDFRRDSPATERHSVVLFSTSPDLWVMHSP